jgi:hypothetical protein
MYGVSTSVLRCEMTRLGSSAEGEGDACSPSPRRRNRCRESCAETARVLAIAKPQLLRGPGESCTAASDPVFPMRQFIDRREGCPQTSTKGSIPEAFPRHAASLSLPGAVRRPMVVLHTLNPLAGINIILSLAKPWTACDALSFPSLRPISIPYPPPPPPPTLHSVEILRLWSLACKTRITFFPGSSHFSPRLWPTCCCCEISRAR